jgi:hypothetical protein
MTMPSRIGSWLALVVATVVVVALVFPDGVHRVQEHYADRFGLAPTIGFFLSVLIGVAGAIALVAPAGVWIAERIFGYTVTPPARLDQTTLIVAGVLVFVGFAIMFGAVAVVPE